MSKVPSHAKVLSIGDITQHGALLTYEKVSGIRESFLLDEAQLRYLVAMIEPKLLKAEVPFVG